MVSESARARRPRTETPVPRRGLSSGLDGGGGGGLWFVRVSEDVRFQVRNQVRVVSILSAQLHPSFPLPASFGSLSLSLSNSLPGCSRPTPCLLPSLDGGAALLHFIFFFGHFREKRSRSIEARSRGKRARSGGELRGNDGGERGGGTHGGGGQGARRGGRIDGRTPQGLRPSQSPAPGRSVEGGS